MPCVWNQGWDRVTHSGWHGPETKCPKGLTWTWGSWMREHGWTSAWQLEMPCLQVSSFDTAINFFKRKHFSLETGFCNFFFQLERFMTYNAASPSIPLPGKALPSAKHIKDSRWTRSQFVSWVFSPLTFSVWTHRWLDFLYSPNWWKICRELGWEQLLVSLLGAENP